MKPLAIAGIVTAGLGLAYVVHAATQSAGEKAKKGDVVRVAMPNLLLVTPAGTVSVPGARAADVASLLVTSSDADRLYGTLRAVANANSSVGVPVELSAPGAIAVRRKDVLA
jgi:hypothetical protein